MCVCLTCSSASSANRCATVQLSHLPASFQDTSASLFPSFSCSLSFIFRLCFPLSFPLRLCSSSLFLLSLSSLSSPLPSYFPSLYTAFCFSLSLSTLREYEADYLRHVAAQNQQFVTELQTKLDSANSVADQNICQLRETDAKLASANQQLKQVQEQCIRYETELIVLERHNEVLRKNISCEMVSI